MNDAIAVFASARRNGNTGKLMDWIGNELGIDIIDLAERSISPYDYEHRNIDDDFLPTMNQILGYSKILFASPVYWYAASAQMKAFIDRTSDFLDLDELKPIGRRLRGKTAYLVCTSISTEADGSFVSSFKDTFRYLGMEFGGHIHANCRDGYLPELYTQQVDQFIERLQAAD